MKNHTVQSKLRVKVKKLHLGFSLLMVITGLVVLIGGLVAQASSRLTPYLVRFPTLLYLFGSIGVFLLLIASIVTLYIGLHTSKRQNYFYAFFYLVLVYLTTNTLLGSVFQLSIAALAVGGGLLFNGTWRILKI